MWSESNGLPIGGGFLLAVLIYAAAAFFGAGPIVGQRTIEKMNWCEDCEAMLIHQIEADRPSPSVTVPKLGCIYGIFGREGHRLCERYGNLGILDEALDQAREVERRKNELIERRLSQAASTANSRCKCAVSLVLEKNATQFALYAGSARLFSPPQVTTNLQSELVSALNSPLCQFKS